MTDTTADAVAVTASDIFEVYYSVPGAERAGMRWVLSKGTVEAIEAAVTSPPPPGWTGDVQLLGRPVRVDDSAVGLTYEILPHKVGVVYESLDEAAK